MTPNKKNISEANFLSYLKSLGFLFPETEKELNRFNDLYSNFRYELSGKEISPQKIIDEVKKEEIASSKGDVMTDSNNKKDYKDYFKRIVLAAEITAQLYQEPTFGHVKLQKMMYLCEQFADMHLPERYAKQAAGPYDRKFMHSIDHQFKRLNWFLVAKKHVASKYTYEALENLDNYKKYYNRYFAKYDKSIQWLIETFRTEKTDFVELVATLHACIEEIIINNEVKSKKVVIQKFYSWSEEKKRFKLENVEEALDWMFDNSLITIKLK
jgi:hypothetical protein